jgi:hypothetical protein
MIMNIEEILSLSVGLFSTIMTVIIICTDFD